jgi:hypothetical protein
LPPLELAKRDEDQAKRGIVDSFVVLLPKIQKKRKKER